MMDVSHALSCRGLRIYRLQATICVADAGVFTFLQPPLQG
jgi:hypothetical protein